MLGERFTQYAAARLCVVTSQITRWQIKTQVEGKVEEVKEDAERLARETAQATTEAISKLALAAFAAIAIGILAASIGGYIGTPEVLPTATVSTSIHIEPSLRLVYSLS